ncbi:MAG: hypothetical protein PWQ22_1291 [Archaeoglobaceae archaeon]|nr:hypothetical protein [Archaeoglobaceae archaeon]
MRAKLLKGLGFAAIICGLIVALYFGLLILGLYFEYQDAAIGVRRLDHQPETCFELTERDLEKYPILAKALEELRSGERRKVIYSIPTEEGNALYKYLLQKQMDAACSPSNTSDPIVFRYQNNSYGFVLMVT